MPVYEGTHVTHPRARRLAAALALSVALVAAASVFHGAGHEARRSEAAERQRALLQDAQPTERSAVETATAFLSSMTLDVLLDVERRRSVLTLYAESSARRALERLYARENDRVASSYRRPPRVARAALLGYRIDGFDRRAATVSLWAASIGGSGNYEPSTGWSTTTVDLVWSERRWRITGVKEEPGPSSDWPIESLANETKTFRAFHYAP